jgi:hypothetical protein
MNAITSQRDAVVTTGLAQPRRVTALTGLLFALSLSLGGCDSKPSTVALAHTPTLTMAEAGDPSLAVDPATKDVLMSWVAGDSTGYRIWFARSSDRGDTWSTPIAITPTGEHLRIHPESSPTLVCEAAGKVGVGVLDVRSRSRAGSGPRAICGSCARSTVAARGRRRRRSTTTRRRGRAITASMGSRKARRDASSRRGSTAGRAGRDRVR